MWAIKIQLVDERMFIHFFIRTILAEKLSGLSL